MSTAAARDWVRRPLPSALPVENIVIDTHKGSAKFRVELAGDSLSQQRGLMFRTELAPDAGMPYLLPLLGVQSGTDQLAGFSPEVIKAWIAFGNDRPQMRHISMSSFFAPH